MFSLGLGLVEKKIARSTAVCIIARYYIDHLRRNKVIGHALQTIIWNTVVHSVQT